MKIAFWLIGATCSGKSSYSKSISERISIDWISLDTVNDRIKIDGMSKKDGYKKLFENKSDVIIVDGIIPFTYKEDMNFVKDELRDYKIIYILVKPNYLEWKERILKKQKEYPKVGIKLLTEEEYNKYNQSLRDRIGEHLEVKSYEDLEVINSEQIRNLCYQHIGFTNIKWKQLKIPSKGNTLLDLGCSSCAYEKYFMQDGGVGYQGLDCNFSYLINEKANLFNLNKLENWKEPADIVVCSSVIHYIHDKEKFIKECARLTKKLCVLEIPLDRREGKALHLGSRNLYFPTKDLFEEWLLKYFKEFKCLGESIVEDGSYRLIYHCK